PGDRRSLRPHPDQAAVPTTPRPRRLLVSAEVGHQPSGGTSSARGGRHLNNPVHDHAGGEYGLSHLPGASEEDGPQSDDRRNGDDDPSTRTGGRGGAGTVRVQEV